ncbi:lipopolysaccharide heptosyltransferase II [Parahalioglobus pacificus]|uniref:lipopolysaccharide heptosyltransferase II n=1 Tax=Parahalioglobus pacificus TaxID=930806 RepID=A0A918XIY5_9GAMM|nr:lipopolysaccharide heptosyltransferase II [Halioglobus pacificus]NQY03788.1 lipopolysaccharide heptosyltransferase II [Halieaceae bacterium]GHD34474.1 heptosyltransferase II [Halioglobus pacificus]
MSQSDKHRTLVIGPAWVGDMVMSHSLYQLLAQRNPEGSIDVMAPAWSQPLLERMPEVRQGLTLPLAHGELGLGVRRKMGHALRGDYDQAILLPNSLKSALLPWFAGIPLRTGWRGEMRFGLLNDIRLLDEQALPLMVQRFVALGQPEGAALPDPLPAPRLTVQAENAGRAAEAFNIADDQPLLALCPGAEFGGAKRWPASHYAELGKHYQRAGWQVVLFGSANDSAVTTEIAGALDAGTVHNLAGKTALSQAIDLLSLADAVVSNDSGLMHIAAALARPLLVLYGATSPGFTPPLSTNAALLVSDIDCAPCFQRECPLGHHRCMRELSPAAAIAQLDELLSREAST